MTKDQYNSRARWILAITFILTFVLALNWKVSIAFVARVAPILLDYYWISYVVLISLWFIGFYFYLKGILSK